MINHTVWYWDVSRDGCLDFPSNSFWIDEMHIIKRSENMKHTKKYQYYISELKSDKLY